MAVLLLKVSAVFYAVVAILGLIQLKWSRPMGDRTVMIGLCVSLLAHALAIGGRTVELGTFALADLHDGLSLLGFLAALFSVGISWKSGVPQAACFASVMVALIVFAAVWVDPSTVPSERLRSPWLPVHIAMAFVGQAAFAVSGMVSIVYLIQESRLKAKKKMPKLGTGLHKLPALEVLDTAGARLIQIGFPLMTVGLLAGAIYGHEATGQYFSWGLLNIVSVLVWIAFALMLHFRMTIGWRGKKAAMLTLAGVGATLLVLVGLGLAGVGAHGAGVS